MFIENRGFLKSPINSPADLVASDQDQGIEAPASQKPYPEDARLIDLIAPDEISLGKTDLVTALRNRRSIRKYSEEKLTLEELSFLLWSVQGVQRLGKNEPVTYRTVPASGGIHPFETYLVIFRVESIQPGFYRYLALEHKLLLVNQLPPDFREKLAFACRGQNFVSNSAVVFIWTAVPYRTEWRYANEAHKAIAQASGHVCQNLYLACEVIEAGTCAITAYAQREMDSLLGVDGENEFVIYLAPVGKVRK